MSFESSASRSARTLTPRQLEILALLAAGESNADIAVRLGLSPSTVKNHLTSIYLKSGARNRVQAVRYYLEHHAAPAETAAPPGPER